MIPGELLVGTPGAKKWSHALGGLVGLEDSDKGSKSGRMHWVGAPSLKWWIDRKGGTCGLFATQLFPPGEVKHIVLSALFQKEVVARFGRASA